MSAKNRLVKAMRDPTVPLTAGLAGAQVIVAINYAIAARGTSPGDFGRALTIVALAAVIAGVVDFGLANFLIRERAAERTSTRDVAHRLLERLLVAVSIGVIVMVGVMVVVRNAPQMSFVLAVLGLITANLAVQSSQVILRATGRLGVVAAATVIDRAIALGVTVLLMAIGWGAVAALPTALGLGLLTDAAICAAATGGRGTLGRFGEITRRVRAPRQWIGSWAGAQAYGVAGVAGSLQQLDVTILNALGGASVAGQYGAVSRWTAPLLLPSTAVTQTGMSRAASAPTTAQAFRRVFEQWWLLALGLGVSVAVAVFAEPLALFVLGDQYANSAHVLAVLAVAVVPTILAQPFAMILQSRGRDGAVARTLVVSLVVRIGLVAIFAAQLGAMAAAIAVAVQQSMTLATCVVLALALHRRDVNDVGGPR